MTSSKRIPLDSVLSAYPISEFIVNEQRKWILQSISSARSKHVKGISFIKPDNHKNDKMTVADAEKFDNKIVRGNRTEKQDTSAGGISI